MLKVGSIANLPNVSHKLKSRPHKQHIWFLPTHKPTQKKPKELFFTNARKKEWNFVNLHLSDEIFDLHISHYGNYSLGKASD
ncbi:hypothetical protein IX84_31225 [Phaeodactylibacter xiamenensis]|uniref:Uncharacterized protein n=1 Tax=Phaeodactylibacter xiamenensis TaxID=1524460 RepID=A0A098RXG3_9BACT|nr:hypothetical protein IX84_31225 [Phaeodactylibacter xiamenensis]